MLRIDDARSQEEDHQILQKQELLALDTQAQEAQSASNPDGEDADDFAALKARAWGQMVPGQVQQHLAGLRQKAEQLQHAHKAPQARPSRILHYHCDHLGTPRELTDEDGKLVWSASYWAWGKLRNPKGRSGGAGTDIASPDAPRNQFWHTRTQPGRSNHLPEWVADNAGNLKRWRELKDAEEPQNTPEAANDPSVWGEPTDQSIRFQGQWHDPETGLHYNRFRYYDPDVGRFIHQDPIGLLGGNNLYQYAPNPTAWVDVFGLKYRSGARSPNVVTGKDKPGKNNLSEWRRRICRQNIANEKIKFLGDDFVRVGEGKWRSIDGTRQFRVTPSDYLGYHGMGNPVVPNTPHIHFEFLQPTGAGNFKVIKNIHVALC